MCQLYKLQKINLIILVLLHNLSRFFQTLGGIIQISIIANFTQDDVLKYYIYINFSKNADTRVNTCYNINNN